MDINCVHSCKHQRYGKCKLKEIPDTLTTYGSNEFMDCLYYEKKDGIIL